jgi:hypothetical protein
VILPEITPTQTWLFETVTGPAETPTTLFVAAHSSRRSGNSRTVCDSSSSILSARFMVFSFWLAGNLDADSDDPENPRGSVNNSRAAGAVLCPPQTLEKDS